MLRTTLSRKYKRKHLKMNSEYYVFSKRELPSNSKLCPKLDSDGIIRSDGRLIFADHEFLPYDMRYPVVLPR